MVGPLQLPVWLGFWFVFETRSHYEAQLGTLVCDPPASASWEQTCSTPLPRLSPFSPCPCPFSTCGNRGVTEELNRSPCLTLRPHGALCAGTARAPSRLHEETRCCNLRGCSVHSCGQVLASACEGGPSALQLCSKVEPRLALNSLSLKSRMKLNLGTPCFHLLGAKINDFYLVLGLEPRASCPLALL